MTDIHGSPNDTPGDDDVKHMTEALRLYATYDDAALASALRQYAIAPEVLRWTERAALLAAVADRLDPHEGASAT
jgi:hypothetical protein